MTTVTRTAVWLYNVDELSPSPSSTNESRGGIGQCAKSFMLSVSNLPLDDVDMCCIVDAFI